MTEQQILTKIDSLDNNDKIQAIIDLVESLPVEERTPKILSEQARAYNNIYWLNPTEDNRKYLQKAIELLLYVQDEEGHTSSWNYRIAYPYLFLGQTAEARKYFEKSQEISGQKEYFLDIVSLVENKGITPDDAIKGGCGGVEYALENVVELIDELAPSVAKVLDKPATEEQLENLEKALGIELPEDFKQLHRTFSGQKTKDLVFANSQRFVGIDEIETVQKQWFDFIRKHYREEAENIRLEDFYEEGVIKNQLFNKKWIPLLTGKYLLCMDLDPDNEAGAYGQVISVYIGENVEDCGSSFLFDSVKEWIQYMEGNLKSGLIYYNEEENYLEFDLKSTELPEYTSEEAEAVENYIEKTFGKIDEVIEDEEPYGLKCDICVIKPTEERNYYTLVTRGMGAYEMEVPEDYQGIERFAELVFYLPADWNLKSQDEKDYWPIRWMKLVANVPVQQESYLSWGHTVPSGDNLEGTNFNCLMLIGADSPEYDEEGEFYKPAIAPLSEEKEVVFYTLMPLYPEEMRYKLSYGPEAIMDKFQEAEIPYPPILDLHRTNSCEGFEPDENHSVLDNVAWAFNQQYYSTALQFFEEVRAYNQSIENDIEDFNPFATVFSTSKVKLMYQAYIESEKDLLEGETLLNPETLDIPEDDGKYYAEILAEIGSTEGKEIRAIELLKEIHNLLFNKDLGDHIFFEGIEIQGFEEDGTPAIEILLGS